MITQPKEEGDNARLETTVTAMRMVEKLGRDQAIAVCRLHGWKHLVAALEKARQ